MRPKLQYLRIFMTNVNPINIMKNFKLRFKILKKFTVFPKIFSMNKAIVRFTLISLYSIDKYKNPLII